MNYLPGHLLVASPTLSDPNFFHSVILLVRHNEDGAFGLVLNRSSGTQLSDVWQQLSEQPCDRHTPIRVGGPIEGPLMALHSNQALVDLEVLPGIYFTAGREKLEQLMGDNESSILFFAGYAGWGPGQLESEIDADAWQAVPATAERVFRELDDFWQTTTKEIASSRLISALGIKHVPVDPRWN